MCLRQGKKQRLGLLIAFFCRRARALVSAGLMSAKPPIRIATISPNPDPDWAWLKDLMPSDFAVAGRALEWRSFSMAESSPRLATLGRWRGARTLAKAATEQPFDLIVSHGPWATSWVQLAAMPKAANTKHLAFSFNFTDLPTGLRKAAMARSFRQVDAFAVFTDAEQRLYADYFGIDPTKILRAPWGVAPPLGTLQPRRIDGEYFASLGGEARDYSILCDSARSCPEVKFVVIARPWNFENLNPPENLEVLFNLPFEEAWGIVQHAKAAIIPLRSRETQCGLVSLVGAMHLGKAQIVTDAVGVTDYIRDGETGLTVPANDSAALSAAIRRIDADPALAERLGTNAKTYAEAHCSEAATIGFFSDLVKRWFGDN